MNYQSSFKTYDIRGIYKKDIDEKLSYHVGKAIGNHILESIGKDGKFMFGADVRLANNSIVLAFLKGMEDVGFDNYFCAGVNYNCDDKELEEKVNLQYDFGLCSTSMIYYLVHNDFDFGASFTASHNGKEYVGMKIVDHNTQLLCTNEIKSWIQGDIDNLGEYTPPSIQEKEKIISKAFSNKNGVEELLENKIMSRKQDLLNSFFGLKRGFKIVVDFSNGAGVGYEKFFLEEIAEFCDLEIIFLNETPDSEFSNHESDTSNEENYKQLSNAVIKNNADLGIMFDGDVDRIGIVDNKGIFHPSDILTGIIIDSLLEEHKSDIVCDVMCSKMVDEVSKKHGVRAIRSKVGYKFVKQLVLENDCVLGGELSGHILFGEYGAFEIPLLSLFYLLDTLDISGKNLSKQIELLHPYYKPGLKNYHVDDADTVIENVKKEYSQYKQDETDGIKIVGDDFWFIIRKSNTEPIIRVCMEADNKEIWEAEMGKLKEIINI